MSITAPNLRAPARDRAIGDDRLRLRGTPASSGAYFGRARVVLTTADLEAIRPGDIVVARALTPDLVGALSNGAILARELGLPTVVGVAGATRLLATSDELLLDGGTGAVDRFPRRG
ncbi:MAG: PEP-utilizing enzyme [Chloroflexi bacterium]|nr:PEP-utilizing enzyme [Chloroflexota bacterium]